MARNVETIELNSRNIFEISMKTGISQAELDMRYTSLIGTGKRVVYTIETIVRSEIRND